MEIILNIAWAVCSLGLVLLWARCARSGPGSGPGADRASRRTQVLALAMVVLLLLPVISLSDDLMAMQGPAETDTCLRKSLHPSDLHPSFTPASWALPAPMVTEVSSRGYALFALKSDRISPEIAPLPRSLDSRPPPRA
jgi:hypothetical protein